MTPTTRLFAAATVAATLATPLAAWQAAPAAAAPQGAPAFTTDTVLWSFIGRNAHQKAEALAAGTPAPNARIVQQYRTAMNEADSGRFADAALSLTAVARLAPNNAVYQADFAYVLARVGRFEDAENTYRRAFQLQQQNAWFMAGIAAAGAAQRNWADAAGTIQLAASTDSAVMGGPVAGHAAQWFEQAGDRAGALTWSRLAVRGDTNDMASYRRIAFYLSAGADTSTEGLAAIRRFRQLAPNDHLGEALYAVYLYPRGLTDSALALSASAARADTALRATAAQLHLQVGRDLLQHRDTEHSLQVLTTGQAWAIPSQQAAFSNIIGRNQLLQLNAKLNALENDRSCGAARAADSLAQLTETNLRAGLSFDSTRTQSMLDNIMPNYKQNAANAVRNCSDAARPAPAPARPTTPARPRPRP